MSGEIRIALVVRGKSERLQVNSGLRPRLISVSSQARNNGLFNSMPQVRSVVSAINLACSIGLIDQNLFTALGGPLRDVGREETPNFLASVLASRWRH